MYFPDRHVCTDQSVTFVQDRDVIGFLPLQAFGKRHFITIKECKIATAREAVQISVDSRMVEQAN